MSYTIDPNRCPSDDNLKFLFKTKSIEQVLEKIPGASLVPIPPSILPSDLQSTGVLINMEELIKFRELGLSNLHEQWPNFAEQVSPMLGGKPSLIHRLSQKGYTLENYARLVCFTEVTFSDYIDYKPTIKEGLTTFFSGGVGLSGSLLTFVGLSQKGLSVGILTGLCLAGFTLGVFLSLKYSQGQEEEKRTEVIAQDVQLANQATYMSAEEQERFDKADANPCLKVKAGKEKWEIEEIPNCQEAFSSSY
ncbi:MAG: hypothetical protein KDK66_08035 [Deltaproteobacteria bacterium]|nr:hypothetical protein [Deltaproteobacteria bacterium]